MVMVMMMVAIMLVALLLVLLLLECKIASCHTPRHPPSMTRGGGPEAPRRQVYRSTNLPAPWIVYAPKPPGRAAGKPGRVGTIPFPTGDDAETEMLDGDIAPSPQPRFLSLLFSLTGAVGAQTPYQGF